MIRLFFFFPLLWLHACNAREATPDDEATCFHPDYGRDEHRRRLALLMSASTLRCDIGRGGYIRWLAPERPAVEATDESGTDMARVTILEISPQRGTAKTITETDEAPASVAMSGFGLHFTFSFPSEFQDGDPQMIPELITVYAFPGTQGQFAAVRSFHVATAAGRPFPMQLYGSCDL
jgi:hypothetical protein